MAKQKPVLPFYGVAALWIGYAFLFPLYLPGHFIFLAALSLAAFFLLNGLCRGGTAPAAETAKEPEKQEKPASTGNPELDKMVKDGSLAIAELKRLDENIADPGISADIVRLEQVSGKIFEEVKRDPKKLSQIQRFMDYYLPTTLKLLNAYDRASSTGISGENVDATKAKVEGMMRTIVSAFEKQLDALYGSEALDISTDITVLETMMAREGLAGEQLKAEPEDGTDIRLEL
ncbi:MAG: hypothetical protein HFG08_08485 [Oscillibacter sp.]|nr:hypothetical protein [Oscillibacter sp.]